MEANPAYAEVAAANIAAASVGDVVELRVGDALEELADLQAQRAGPFDLLFIDADKQRIPEYFEAALALSRPGSLIVVDNVVRRAAIVDATARIPACSASAASTSSSPRSRA